MKSQVTTKRGDSGETTALNGEDYPKDHPVMVCTGTVDELRAHTALARLMLLERLPKESASADFLLWVTHTYFLIGTACSDPAGKLASVRGPGVAEAHVEKLEAEQARLEKKLELPRAFIVSAANPVSAQVDVACTVARRLERCLVTLRREVPEFQQPALFRFVNRLSDYLFILARHLEGGEHQPVDKNLLSA